MCARRTDEARLTLAWPRALVCAACLAGCVVPEPEDKTAPTRTPPILDLARARPFVGSVPVRSNDQGTKLLAGLSLNFSFARMNKPVLRDLRASTMDNLSRRLEFDFDFTGEAATPGCSQLSLLVTHEDNWDYSMGSPKWPDALPDTATAMWWVNVAPSAGQESTLRDCPNPSEQEPSTATRP